MDALTYLRSLLRSWWLVLLVLLAGGLGGFLVYERSTPQYASTVQVVVASDSPKIDESSARALTELRAGTIADVADTQPVLESAADAAGTGDDLDGVAVTSSASNSFITVQVTGPSAQVVRDIAAAYPDVMPDATDKLVGQTGTKFTLNMITPANLPSEPFAPVLSRDVGLGLAAGLVLGLALAVLRESLNRTLRTSEQLRELTGLTVLGTVPRDLPKEPLPAASHPRSARAEAYRQIRTTVMSSAQRRPLVLAVTSATAGEGKTSVATNLAVVLSRAGHRVALVDADLRRPRVAEFFQLESDRGLTDVLTGATTLDDALAVRDEGRLAVLPAGTIPANPSEALGSPGMREVLVRLTDSYEFVVIDTPPVLPVTDALVLAPVVDGTILVARLGYSTRERIERAMAGVNRVNATVLGVVPNQATRSSDGDYSYSYRYRGSKEPDTDVAVGSGALAGPAPGGPAPSAPTPAGAAAGGGSGRHSGNHRVVPVEATVNGTTPAADRRADEPVD